MSQKPEGDEGETKEGVELRLVFTDYLPHAHLLLGMDMLSHALDLPMLISK